MSPRLCKDSACQAIRRERDIHMGIQMGIMMIWQYLASYCPNVHQNKYIFVRKSWLGCNCWRGIYMGTVRIFHVFLPFPQLQFTTGGGGNRAATGCQSTPLLRTKLFTVYFSPQYVINSCHWMCLHLHNKIIMIIIK